MRIITTACWIVTALALAGLASWFLTGTVFGIRAGGESRNFSSIFHINTFATLTGPYNVVGTYNEAVSGIDSLNIDWTAGDVTVRPYDGDDIRITEMAQRELRETEHLQLKRSGNTLNISFCGPGTIRNIPVKKLEVLVPRALSGSFSVFTINTISGPVFVDDINADKCTIKTASGRITLAGITAGTVDVGSISGTIIASSIRADDLKVDSTSGSVSVTDSAAISYSTDTISGSVHVSGEFDKARLMSTSGRITADNSAPGSDIYAETISGSIEVSGSFATADFNSTSGKLSVRSSIVPSSLKAHSISGSITIAVPGGETITVHHSSMSGRFSSDVPVTIQGRGAQFELSTTSGSIRIIEY